MRRFLFAPIVVLLACGSKTEPTTPTSAASSSAAPAEKPPTEATDPSNPPAPAKKKRPLEIHNACNNVVTIVFGEDPNAKEAGQRTIAPGSSIDGPRDDNGNVTVHLLDEKSQPLVKVHVTRGMKRVEVGASCRTLDAR
jgi:hypothetical protein